MEKCNSTIRFADDEGDNSCTFYCQLPLYHIGQHEEVGDMYGQKYRLVWEGDDTSDDYDTTFNPE